MSRPLPSNVPVRLTLAHLVLTGIGLRVLNVTNVIIRNVKIAKVLAPGDNIGIQSAHQVWVDHVDLSSDLDHSKDLCVASYSLTSHRMLMKLPRL